MSNSTLTNVERDQIHAFHSNINKTAPATLDEVAKILFEGGPPEQFQTIELVQTTDIGKEEVVGVLDLAAARQDGTPTIDVKIEGFGTDGRPMRLHRPCWLPEVAPTVLQVSVFTPNTRV